MNKQYKIGDEVLVRGIVNSEVRNGGIHVLHDGVDAFYILDQIHEPQKVVVSQVIGDLIEKLKIDELFKNQQPRFLTCDKPLCDRCSNIFHGMDLCRSHNKKITGGIK
ncbi:hypothetical protein [Streptococcus suis]|uniref:hypothetical protein n=1 Tax=Streptococcus suis TaxID=1307 RepID=UPI0038B87480